MMSEGGRPTTALEEELRRLDDLIADWLGLDTEVRLIPIRPNKEIVYIAPSWQVEVILRGALGQRWSCRHEDPVRAVARMAQELPDLVVRWRTAQRSDRVPS